MSADPPTCLKLNHFLLNAIRTGHNFFIKDSFKKTLNCRDNIFRLSTEQNDSVTTFMAHCHFEATHIKLQKSCVDSATSQLVYACGSWST